MSDSEGDFSDELLELAGASGGKRKKRQGGGGAGSSKRRKDAPPRTVALSDDSEDMVESEDEQDDEANPYPLEGKYKNEADRNMLMDLSEIEREEILAQRLEELQRLQDKRSLDAMVREQRGETGDGDGGGKSGKRQHAIRGATKEKTNKMLELVAKRKAKDDKKTRTKGDASPKRERSSSPSDMAMSSDEDEDGQISRLEQEEERDRRLYGSKPAVDDEVTVEDLRRCALSRDMIAKSCLTPWFEDYVKGAYVRYLIGTSSEKSAVYRICEIENLAADTVRPYKINETPINQNFELRHGKSTKVFPMDRVSNAPFDPREFAHWQRSCRDDDIKPPTKRQLERKAAQMRRLEGQPMTEADIAKMLEKRRQLMGISSGSGNAHQPSATIALERSRLQQMRTLALRRQDDAEVAELDRQLAALGGPPGDGATPAGTGGHSTPVTRHGAVGGDEVADRLAKVNEKNRRAYLEQVRKAELAEAEKKRMRRKLEGTSRTATPDPKLGSRPATPLSAPAIKNGTPVTGALASGETAPDPLETSMVDSVEVDLGDF